VGLIKRLRDVFTAPTIPAGDPAADAQAVRAALDAEARRLGRRTRLSLTLLMEYSSLDVTAIDLHAALGHLEARGEIVNVQPDSFGNLRFDLPGADDGSG
jgi:hypothetical protein